jgi:hypothetical protein
MSINLEALSGPALTAYAYQHGLAPDGVVPSLGESGYFYRLTGYPWEPHRNIVQAREVFFGLEDLGFYVLRGRLISLEEEKSARRCVGMPGVSDQDGGTVAMVFWGLRPDADQSEATALLRCACEAMEKRIGETP